MKIPLIKERLTSDGEEPMTVYVIGFFIIKNINRKNILIYNVLR